MKTKNKIFRVLNLSIFIISIFLFIPSFSYSEDKPFEKAISIFDLEPEFTKENIDIEKIDFASFEEKWADLHKIYNAQRLFYYKMPAKEALDALSVKMGKSNVSEIKEKLGNFFLPEHGYALTANFGKYDIYVVIDADEDDTVSNAIYINAGLNKAYENISSKAFIRLSYVKASMTEEEVKTICGEPEKVEDASGKKPLKEYYFLYRTGPRNRTFCGIVFSKKDKKTTGAHVFIR
jgi:hypothetical protein